MIRPDPDWVFLRQGMLLPALCLLVGTALWGTTTMYRTRLTNTLETERQELASIEQERQELISRREAREQYSAIYQQLTTDRIVGPEQRLQWVQRSARSTRVPGPAVHALLGPPPGSFRSTVSHKRHHRAGDQQPDGYTAGSGA